MIKNQFVADPESTPPRNTGGLQMNTNSAANGVDFDDPWYKSSPQSSPAGGTAPTGFYNQGFQQFNPATTTSNQMFTGVQNTYNAYGNPVSGEEDYENEPPLLEELGIRFDHITTKTQAVLYLNKVLNSSFLSFSLLICHYFFLAH